MRLAHRFFLIAFTSLLFSVSFGQDAQLDYRGHSVIAVETRSIKELDKLLAVVEDVWSENVGVGWLDVRVGPKQLDQIRQMGLRYYVRIPDVQALIEAERAGSSGQFDGDPFADYMDLAAVNAYVDQLVALRPDLAKVVSVGTSLRGRAIRGIALSAGIHTVPLERPGTLFNGCQHAREWISVAVPLWIATRLINEYGIDPRVTRLLSETVVYIVPVVNPDGYDYTWTNERLWRKNRRGSYGVDLNRNWAKGWGGEGSSGNQGSPIYRGTTPFSEPESSALRDFARTNRNIRAHIDFHSFSQLILWPWGYTIALSANDLVFREIGTRMQADIAAVNGLLYQIGPVYTTIYPASGGIVDWMYDAMRIMSYTIELRDRGEYGFILPRGQIQPTCREVYPAALRLMEWVESVYTPRPGNPPRAAD